MATEANTLANKLQAAGPEQRAQVKEAYLAALREDLDSLVSLLEAKSPQFDERPRIDPASAEYQAVEILSFVRYTAAGGLFARYLHVRSSDFSVVADETHSHYQAFPFALALAATGTQAGLSILTEEISAADPKSTRFQLSCLVLKQILDEPLAIVVVEDLNRNDANFQNDGRYEQALRFVKMRPEEWKASFCSDFAAR